MDTKVCRNMIYILYTFCTHHCVKSGVISGPYFPVFSPNTEKYGPKITPYLDTFHAAIVVIDTEHYESIVDKITLDF